MFIGHVGNIIGVVLGRDVMRSNVSEIIAAGADAVNVQVFELRNVYFLTILTF